MLPPISLPISLWVTLTGVLGSTPTSPLLQPSAAPATCTRDAGLVLPQGFCAVLVAQGLGSVRHITVAPNGDIFAAVMSGGSGAVVALRDTSGDAVADIHKWFGSGGGSGIALHNGYLYFAGRYPGAALALGRGQLEPKGDPETIVNGLPNGGHAAKSLAFLGGDTMIVNIGSATNSCQRADRQSRSPGTGSVSGAEGARRVCGSSVPIGRASANRTGLGSRPAFAMASRLGSTPPAENCTTRLTVETNWPRTGASPTSRAPSYPARSCCSPIPEMISAGPTATTIICRESWFSRPSTVATARPWGAAPARRARSWVSPVTGRRCRSRFTRERLVSRLCPGNLHRVPRVLESGTAAPSRVQGGILAIQGRQAGRRLPYLRCRIRRDRPTCGRPAWRLDRMARSICPMITPARSGG